LNKGRALVQLLQEYGTAVGESTDFDFILAVGDERTDEDMFDVLQGRWGRLQGLMAAEEGWLVDKTRLPEQGWRVPDVIPSSWLWCV
jgi:hypothetical protein